MDLNKFLNEEWSIEHADACPIFIDMTGSGFTRKLYDSTLPVYKLCVVYYAHGEADWMTLVNDQQAIGSEIVRSHIKKPEVVPALYHEWLKSFDKMMAFYYENIQVDLSALSDKELKSYTRQLYDFYRIKTSMPGFIDGFMFYADKRFDQLVREFCAERKIDNYPKIFSALCAPVDESFINEEARDLRKLANGLRKAGYRRGQDLRLALEKNGKLGQAFSNHLFKYAWIKSSYCGYKEYTLHDIQEEIDGLLYKRSAESDTAYKEHRVAKRKLIQRYKFTPEIMAIVRLTEIFIKWQDQRKIYTLTFVTLQHRVLDEISKRLKIESELLKYLTGTELLKAIGGKASKGELVKRQQGFIVIYRNGKAGEIVLGQAAKIFLKKVSKVKVDDAKEIKGMTASTGKVRGIARIILSVKQIDNVKAGDILIAPMTRPEHLPAMKKAAAIVTDDGGITCHAAIVARELKKPCIIGTKIATKALTDGQMVEVDADNGIIKILN